MEIDYNEDLGLQKIEKTNEAGQVITQLHNFPNGYYYLNSVFDGDDGYNEVSVNNYKFQLVNGYYTRFVVTLYDKDDAIINQYCNSYNIIDGEIVGKEIRDMINDVTVTGISLAGKYYDGNKIGILLQYNETGLYSDEWNNRLVLNDVNFKINGLDYDLSNNKTEEYIFNIFQREVGNFDFELRFNETSNMESCFISFDYVQNKNTISFYNQFDEEIVDDTELISYIDEYRTEKIIGKTSEGLIIPQLLCVVNKKIFGDKYQYTDNNGIITINNLVKDDDFVEWSDNSVNPFDDNLIVCKDNCELVWEIKHNEDYILEIGQKIYIEIKGNSQKWKFTYDNKTLEYENKFNLNGEYLLSIGKTNDDGDGLYRIMIDNNLICGLESKYFTDDDVIYISNDKNILDKKKIAIGNEIAHTCDMSIDVSNDKNINDYHLDLFIKLQELNVASEIDYLVDGFNKKKVINNYSIINITKGDINGIVFNNRNQSVYSTTNIIDLEVKNYNLNNVLDFYFYRKNNHSILKLLHINRNIYPMNWKLVDSNYNNNDYNIEFNLSVNEINLNSEEENQSAIEDGLDFYGYGDIGIANVPVTLIETYNGVSTDINTIMSADDGSLTYNLNKKLNETDNIYNYQYKLKILANDLTEFDFKETFSEVQNIVINKYVERQTGMTIDKHISKIEVFGENVNSDYYVYVYDDYNVTMNLTLDNKTYTVENGTLVNGKYRYYFNLGKLKYGQKTITITTVEESIDRNLILSETKTSEFVVDKLMPIVNISSITKNNNNISYIYSGGTSSNNEEELNINQKLYIDDNVVIKGNTNALSGTSLFLRGEIVGTVDNNGDFSITIPVNNDNLTFDLILEENELTRNKTIHTNLSDVNKIGTTITLTGSTTYWGQSTNITAKIVDENNVALNGVALTLNGSSKTTNTQGTATFTVTLGNTANVTTSYKCTYGGNAKYKNSEKSLSLTTKKRPVTIETLHPTGTSSSKPVYKTWELKYRVKDSVTGATISSPTVAIYVDGSKQTTSYSSGIIKCSMPNLGASTGKTVKVKCSFSHSNYDSKTTSEQNVYYISYKTFLRVPTHFANADSLPGGRCMWSDKDGNRTNAEMVKEDLKYGSGNSSYLICSNKEYPFNSNEGTGYTPDRRKPVQLNMSSWTTATSLPSSVKTYNAYVYLRERNPSYTYRGKSYGSRVGKPSLKMTFASGTKTVSSSSIATDTITDIFNGVDISSVTWSNLRSSMSATLNHGVNTGSKLGILYLAILCIRIIYIPKQSGY